MERPGGGQAARFSLEELHKAFSEVELAYRKGNAPRLGAALCDLEYHTQEGLRVLERRFPFFKAADFRKVIVRNHAYHRSNISAGAQ